MKLASKKALAGFLGFKPAAVKEAEEQALKQVADTVSLGTDDETLQLLENYRQEQQGE